MHSAIYQGNLRHRRFHPRAHEFNYAATLFYIDLEELPQLFNRLHFWSLDGWKPGQFRRSDYLGDPQLPLIDCVRAEVQRHLGHCPQGPVRILTNLRIWGFCFNPVTFYYVFAPDAEVPSCILAQVNNTPWNKRHTYLVACDTRTGKANTHFQKQFHVSPFNPLDMSYHWQSTNPAETLAVHMENHREGLCHMDATLSLRHKPWSTTALNRILWQSPWQALKVPLAIYWQALKLFLKGVPVYGHRQSNEKASAISEIAATTLRKVD